MFKVGWCEIGSLIDLDLYELPIKIDTGAKTSSLHALNIQSFEHNGEQWVRFDTLDDNDLINTIESAIYDKRAVTSSNGQSQTRYVIKTNLKMGDQTWPIELTLADRSSMKFKMLLGRRAMDDIQVIPSKKYLL